MMRRLSKTFPSVKHPNSSKLLPSVSIKSEANSPSKSKSRSWSVYLILSTNTPIKTYVGITTDFSRRLKQHNGELKGGAKASCAGRPWICACLIHGFKDQSEVVKIFRPAKVLIFWSISIMYIIFYMACIRGAWSVLHNLLYFDVNKEALVRHYLEVIGMSVDVVGWPFYGGISSSMNSFNKVLVDVPDSSHPSWITYKPYKWLKAEFHIFNGNRPACAFESKWKILSRSLPRKRKDDNKVDQVNDLSLPLLQHRQAALNRVKGIFDCTHLDIDWKLNPL